MRKLVYYVATTLDGYIAGPNGGDPTGQPYFPLTENVIGAGVPLFHGPFTTQLCKPVDTVQLPEGVRVITLDRA